MKYILIKFTATISFLLLTVGVFGQDTLFVELRNKAKHCSVEKKITYFNCLIEKYLALAPPRNDSLNYAQGKLYVDSAIHYGQMMENLEQELIVTYFLYGKLHDKYDKYLPNKLQQTISIFNDAKKTATKNGDNYWEQKLRFEIGKIYHNYEHYDTAASIYIQCLELRDTEKNLELKAEINLKLGKLYEVLDNDKQAIKYLKSSLEYFDAIKSRHAIKKTIEIYQNIGHLYRSGQDSFSVVKNYNIALELAIKNKMPELEASTYNVLGNFYQLKSYDSTYLDKAHYHYKRYYETSVKNNNAHEIFVSLSTYAIASFYKGQKYTALNFFKDNLQEAKKNEVAYRICIGYANIAYLYSVSQEADSALAYLDSTQMYVNKVNSLSQRVEIYQNMAKVLFDGKKYPEALTQANLALELAKKLNNLNYIIIEYSFLLQIYDIQKDYKSSLKYYKLKEAATAKMRKQRAPSVVMREAIEFQNSKREIEQKRKDERTQNELNRRNLIINFIAITAIIIAIALIIIILLFRKRKWDAIFLQNIINSLPHPFIVIDTDSQYVVHANAASNITTSQKEPIKCNSIDSGCSLSCNTEQQKCDLRETILTNNSRITQISKTRNNITTYVEIHNYPFIAQKDNKKLIAQYHIDVTERKLIEEKVRKKSEELEKLNIEKDKILSVIGHDMGNYLNITQNYSERISKNHNSTGIISDFARKIFTASRSAYELMSNLLNWARKNQKSAVIVMNSTELHSIVRKTLNQFTVQAEDKKLSFHNKIVEGTSVFADVIMLQTVIRNLISNAIKFTPENGSITLSAKEDEKSEAFLNGSVSISITDTGVGISEENIKKLTKSNKIFTTRGTQHEKGTGLGLQVCFDFIHRNKGKILIESTHNVGTTFTLKLHRPKNQKTQAKTTFNILKEKENTSHLEKKMEWLDNLSKDSKALIYSMLSNPISVASKSGAFENYKKLGQKAIELGTELKLNNLRDFGEKIKNSAECFDVRNVKILLVDFELILKKVSPNN